MVAGLVAIAVMVLGGATAANANFLVPPTPTSAADGSTITVAGNRNVAGTNFVGVAICNYTLGGNSGTHCDGVNDQGGIAVSGSGNWATTTFVVDATFTNVDLSTGAPSGGTTNCNAVGTECRLFYSGYATWPPTAGPLEVVGLSFTITP